MMVPEIFYLDNLRDISTVSVADGEILFTVGPQRRIVYLDSLADLWCWPIVNRECIEQASVRLPHVIQSRWIKLIDSRITAQLGEFE